MRLKNRTAIITGAATGIGHATARLFIQEGARVLAVGLPRTGLEAALSDLPEVTPFEQDIAAAGAPQRIVEAAIEAFGSLDILVNNAGISAALNVEEVTEEAFDRHMDVNARAQFFLAQAAVPYLKKSPAGRIINVSSVMATHTNYGLTAYCASKAAVTGLTRSLALELGRYGITANYILPGAIETPMTSPGWQDETIKTIWAKKSPLKRVGQPQDIARGILFLASDDSAFITGHGLNIDGGMLLRT
jgi:3-oxoacyl-[acyl-carrier protein] reductase